MHGGNKKGTVYNLLSRDVDIIDKSYRSDYFIVSDLGYTLTSGKNFFTINGSNKLKPNAAILLEIVDSENNVLYYETAKSGYFKYLDTTDLIVGVHVYESTPIGFGTVTLLGTTVDGKSVRWSTNIKINSKLENSSRVVFFQDPKIEISEFLSFILNQNISQQQQFINEISGNIYGYTNFPNSYSDIKSVDFTKFDSDYRLRYIDTSSIGNNNLFSKDNINNEIILNVKEIAYLDNFTIKTASLNITESFRVKNVINNFELQLDRPFTYKTNNINQIVPIISASFNHKFFSNLYITSSGLTGSGDGTPDPTVFLNQQIAGETKFLKEAFLDITYKNLKTLTGKVHRHKIYRRSLNKASDFECIADELLVGKEFIADTSTVNRFYSNIGEFYNLDHINRYYYTSSSDLSLSHSSVEVLNSLVCNIKDSNLDQSRYIIIKNDTSLKTKNEHSSSYIDYDDASFLIQTGLSYDSNFIKLYKNADYLFSANLEIEKNDLSLESKLLFYFTGSYNTASAIVEKNYSADKGLILHQYVLPIGTNFKRFTKKDFNELYFLNDYVGTIVIVPVNIKKFRLDNLSLKSHAERGFSSDSFFTRISFPVIIKNEQFEIKSELLDINNNSIYSDLNKIIAVDKFGETLFRNISGVVNANAETVLNLIGPGSGKISFSASRDDQTGSAALSVIESFDVIMGSLNGARFFQVEKSGNETYMKLSGSFYLTGSQYIKDGGISASIGNFTNLTASTFIQGNQTIASGLYSHAQGSTSLASNTGSHAEGRQTTASGQFSHAEGEQTTAGGYASHAEGSGSLASGTGSHAEGFRTTASADYQHVSGKFNVTSSNTNNLFIIGNGTSENNRSNILVVSADSVIVGGSISASSAISGSTLHGTTSVTSPMGNFTNLTASNISASNAISGSTLHGTTSVTSPIGNFTNLTASNISASNAISGSTLRGTTSVTSPIGNFTNLTASNISASNAISGSTLHGTTLITSPIGNFTNLTASNISASGAISGSTLRGATSITSPIGNFTNLTASNISASNSISGNLFGTSSYAKTSSLGYFVNYTDHNNNFTASNFGQSARTASGYIITNVNGSDIYIPYYSNI